MNDSRDAKVYWLLGKFMGIAKNIRNGDTSDYKPALLKILEEAEVVMETEKVAQKN